VWLVLVPSGVIGDVLFLARSLLHQLGAFRRHRPHIFRIRCCDNVDHASA